MSRFSKSQFRFIVLNSQEWTVVYMPPSNRYHFTCSISPVYFRMVDFRKPSQSTMRSLHDYIVACGVRHSKPFEYVDYGKIK